MGNHISQTSTLTLSPTNEQESIRNKEKQAEFDEMKNRVSKLEEIVSNLQTSTISKAEHEARIAKVEENCKSRIDNLQEDYIQMREKEKAEFQQQIAQIKEAKEVTDESLSKKEAQEMKDDISEIL